MNYEEYLRIAVKQVYDINDDELDSFFVSNIEYFIIVIVKFIMHKKIELCFGELYEKST